MLSVSFYSVEMFLSMYTGKGMQEPLVLDCAHCEPSDIALMKDLS